METILIILGTAVMATIAFMFLRIGSLKNENEGLKIVNDMLRTRNYELIDEKWAMRAEKNASDKKNRKDMEAWESREYTEADYLLDVMTIMDNEDGNICHECSGEISSETMEQYPGMRICDECMLEDRYGV